MLYTHYGGPGYYDSVMGGGPGILGLIFSLVVIAMIIGAILYVLRTFAHHSRFHGPRRDPVDIARERYAKGEITKEELADIKKELG